MTSFPCRNVVSLFLLIGCWPVFGAEAPRDAALEAWRAARFGLFIHWGPVSLKGTEISFSRAAERRGWGGAPDTGWPPEIYDNLYKEFNPVRFDAAEWVAIARAAGVKYMVFGARHHDGFAMFDTQASDYKITSPLSPFGRDVLRELADASHAADLDFGIYYSQPDWHHPDAFVPGRHHRYLDYLKVQVRELLTNYGRVNVLWFDGLRKTAADYDGEALNRMARQLQPQILINNRNGLPGDFETPEQRVGRYRDDRPWESCITICRQWAWKPDDEMKSLKECLQTLILCAGGDGNLLLNVGPMPDGRIEPRQVDRLREIGDWLGDHGPSIYGTRGGPWKPSKGVASTRRGNLVFVHLLRRATGAVELPALPRKIRSAKLPGGDPVTFAQDAETLTLRLSEDDWDPIDTIVRLELDGSAMDLPVMEGALEFTASSSNALAPQQQADNEPARVFDQEPATWWSPDGPDEPIWIAARYHQPITIQRVRIEEALGERVTRFELECRVAGGWKTVIAGTKIGRWFQQSFEPITTTEVRLRILASTDTPAIADMEFFEK